jgi:hypothetical protein
MGMDAQSAGIQAHRSALDYAQTHSLQGGPYSLIHPGAHIEISDGEIRSINGDDKLGYLKNNAVDGIDKSSHDINASNGDMEKQVAGNKETAVEAEIERAEQSEESTQENLDRIQQVKQDLANDHSPQAEDLKAQATQAESMAREKIAESQRLRETLEQGAESSKSASAAEGKVPVSMSSNERLVQQSNLMHEFAKKMGIDSQKLEADFRGGVPVEINGQRVPENLMSEKQLASKALAERMNAMMDGESNAPISGEGADGAQEISSSEYGYENFSGDMDRSVQELKDMKEKIFSEYKGTIDNDEDIYNRINDLEKKVAKADAGGSGSALDFSPLNLAEQRQLDTLNEYRKSLMSTYDDIFKSLFDLKNESNAEFLEENASQYIEKNKASRVAKIFSGLKETMTPEKITENNLNPLPSENVHDWSRRLVIFMLKNKTEKTL